MNKNIIDYVKEYGELSFSEKPFCEVDSLILSKFSYFRLDGLVPRMGEDLPAVTLQDLAASPAVDNLFPVKIYEKSNRELFEAMLGAARFADMTMDNYVSVIETTAETQFSAICFHFIDTEDYVAFRGTDENIVGWKEDFNLALRRPYVGQIMSVDYLNRIALQIDGQFLVGGHSKGGNLAYYSAMFCEEQVRERIVTIYSHDGPGFRPEVWELGQYARIKDRVAKTVPQASLVGMIFDESEEIQVIHSNGIGPITQHDPYSWIVKDGQFKRDNALNSHSILVNRSINEWILSLDEAQIQAVGDTVFQVLSVTEAGTLLELTDHLKENVTKILEAVAELDDESKKMVMDAWHSLADYIVMNVKHSWHEAKDETLEFTRHQITLIDDFIKKTTKKLQKK